MIGKKGAPAQRKPEKPARARADVQVIRKTNAMRLARVILWVMLAFVFLRGAVGIVRGGDGQAAELERYRRASEAARTRAEQLLPFAEDFAREYMTYRAGGEQDYLSRLRAYAPESLFSGVRLGGASAEAVSATAYRHEPYSDTQEDVWVRLTVRYTTRDAAAETGETVETRELRETTLKVPVACTDGGFVVEDLPAFVADERKAPEYKAESYTGTSADRETRDAVEAALTNFFRAYYAEDQSVIRYYLTPDADAGDFLGLEGRLAFARITDCKVYLPPEGSDALLAIVSLDATDVNGQVMPQRWHLELLRQDGQYHIRGIDTRTKNI